MVNSASNSSTISVLIPARNGADSLTELLAMLSIQSVTVGEILVADSGSDDNTVEIARSYGAMIVPVEAAAFDHGGTRTLLCRKAKGDLLVFLTQDSLPKRKDALEKLIAPLLEDEHIAATYGRQLPAFNADFFARSLRNFNYPQQSAVRSIEDRHRLGITTAFTSNSFAAYRRVYLEEIGFFKDNLIFGEDTIAVARLLEKGRKIAYAATAEVYHSHNYTAVEEFKRYFDIGVLHSSEVWFIRLLGGVEGQGKKYIRYMLSCLYREKKLVFLPEFVLRTWMKYCGYKLGRYYTLLPKYVVPLLSLHKSWWEKELK